MAGPDHPRGRVADAPPDAPDTDEATERSSLTVDDDRFWVPDDPLDIRRSTPSWARQGNREVPPLPDSPAAKRTAAPEQRARAADALAGMVAEAPEVVGEADTPAARRAALVRFAADNPLAGTDCPAGTRRDAEHLDPESARWVEAYITRNVADRPWLEPAAGRDPLVQYVYVARDLAGGHDLRRHEGHRGDDGQADRALRHMDPAHGTDAPAYLSSTDALRGGDTLPDSNRARRAEQHFCGTYATRISDPDAYAVAVARTYEHPEVRRALDLAPASGPKPTRITNITIAEILGPDGHRACSGYERMTDQFESDDEAKVIQRKWVEAVRTELMDGAASWADAWENVRQQADGRGVIEPKVAPISTFEGGGIEVRFAQKKDGSGYEISTLYPYPARMTVVDSTSKDYS